MASLGQELKQAREKKGLSLPDIANATHIGARFLQAIEEDTYKILPGGIFTRAFVRKFAKEVGLNEDEAARLYEKQLAEMGGEPVRLNYLGLDDLEERSSSSGNSILVAIVAILVLGAGAYAAYSVLKGKPAAPVTTPPVVVSTPTPQPTETPTPDALPTVTPSPEAAAVTGLRMQLMANTESCWVRVRADNEKGQDVLLNPGDTREITAEEKIVLNIGKLPALRIMINGRPVNPSKLSPGKSVVVDNVVITKDNYQQFVD